MQGQGKVVIGRDAGQVVAGNAITHINKYIENTSQGALAMAFLGSASVALAWLCMTNVIHGATARASYLHDEIAACQYQGGAYSVGAIQLMGRTEKVCTIVDGLPTWIRG